MLFHMFIYEIVESWRKLAETKTRGRDDEFTSGKGKSQTDGHRKILLTFLSIWQSLSGPVLKLGRHEEVFSCHCIF